MSDEHPKPGLPHHLDFGEAQRRGAEDQFWAIRGHAIQAYANLEQALCRLFAMLSGMDDRTAAIIFFRITNTSARNAIIERLFRGKFQTLFNLFRNSLMADLHPIDSQRNEIVHWNVTNQIDHDSSGNMVVEVIMQPPTFITAASPDAPRRNTKDLIDFITKCSFYAQLITMFHVTLDDRSTTAHNLSEDAVKTWRGIFLQPITYPPPEDHPLSPKPAAPDNQPPPSQA
jgi:hypothetical protein